LRGLGFCEQVLCQPRAGGLSPSRRQGKGDDWDCLAWVGSPDLLATMEGLRLVPAGAGTALLAGITGGKAGRATDGWQLW